MAFLATFFGSFFFKDYIFSMLVCMFICASHACSVHGGQKRVLDPLEMELKVVMNCHVSAGNRAVSL